MLTREGRLRERLDYSINFHKVLARTTRNQVMIIMIDALTYILRILVNQLGPHPRLDLVESRCKILGHSRARDADAAVAEMTDHLTKLHQHRRAECAGSIAAGCRNPPPPGWQPKQNT